MRRSVGNRICFLWKLHLSWVQSNRWIYIRHYANERKRKTRRIQKPKIQRSKRRLDFNRVEAETVHITLSRYNNNKTIKIKNFTRTFLGRIVSHHKRLTTTRNRPLTSGRIESDSKNVEASGVKAFLVKNRTKDATKHCWISRNIITYKTQSLFDKILWVYTAQGERLP